MISTLLTSQKHPQEQTARSTAEKDTANSTAETLEQKDYTHLLYTTFIFGIHIKACED